MFAELQPLVIGGVLVWSGGFKLFARSAPLAAAASALRTLLGPKWTLPGYRAVGVAELAVAAAVVLPPSVSTSLSLPAAFLAICFLGYLTYARLKAPESSCGCSSAQRSPIGWRHFGNAGFLLAASLIAWSAEGFWATSLAKEPLVALAILLAEAAVVIGLSPQLDGYWLIPLRRLRVRVSHPLAAATSDVVPLHATVQTLERSPAFRSIGRTLRSDVLESWEEGEWRLVRYSARYAQRPASAVFAVPRGLDEPDRVKVAVVDEADDSVLFAL